MPAHLARALALIALLWAAIYLPGLGSLEIKGEEGRRILPGTTMLETGNWVVPSIGGVDYFSKPPLINWAIAAAVYLSGRQDEWAARAPSALSVLVLGAGTVWLLTGWLGASGALLAAIFMLTSIGMMEKGRLAEIEAMYISLFGLALVTWLALWRQTRLDAVRGEPSRATVWFAWSVAWIFLGFGLLTKGPLHLVFFYAIVAGVLLAGGRARELWTWPHLAGVVLMLGIFAAWAVPYLRLTATERVGQVWGNQMANRFEIDEGFRPAMWALNIPRSLVNFVPWTVLLPLLWRRRTYGFAEVGTLDDKAILRGGRWALAACFLCVSLAPGGVPRYTLPLLVPASVLLALVCVRGGLVGELPPWLPIVWARTVVAFLVLAGVAACVAARAGGGGWRWLAAAGPLAACVWLGGQAWSLMKSGHQAIPPLAILSAAVMALLTMSYAIGAVPRIRGQERLRPLAGHVNQLAGPQAPLYAYQPGFLPILFYLHPSPRYVQRIKDLPASARCLLVNEKDYRTATRELPAAGFLTRPALTLAHVSRGTWYVLRLEPARKLD